MGVTWGDTSVVNDKLSYMYQNTLISLLFVVTGHICEGDQQLAMTKRYVLFFSLVHATG